MDNPDWRLNIARAAKKLRQMRAAGMDLKVALDGLRGCKLTLPAVHEAIIEVEGMSEEEIVQLFDERGDWDEFY